jgi:hypothetical protein
MRQKCAITVRSKNYKFIFPKTMSNNNSSNLETSMKNIKPAGLTDHEKEYSWSKIEAGLTAPVPAFSYIALFKRAQSKFIAITVGLLILGGGAATASAHYAKPGDFFFPVAIAKEKAQIFLATDIKKKEVLHIKFAEKRLAEVRELAALAHLHTQASGSTTVTTTNGSSTATATTPAPVISKNEAKKIERAERAMTIALAQLTETRQALADAGNTGAAFVIDDIIEELKGVGDGAVTITHIAAKGNGQSGQMSLRATITASSSASSTFAGTVRIEEKKNSTKIVLKDNNIKTEVTLGNTKGNSDKKDDDHGNKPENKPERKHEKDDDDEDDDHDRDDRNNHDDKKNGRKVDICHISGTSRQTINIAVNAARAHIAHGDTLGVCTITTTPGTSDTAAPTLTNIAAAPLQSTATISWSTNEQATAYVWFSTTSPVVTTGTPTQERTSLSLAHTFSLSGLTSGTTYYYIVSSSDATGNRATSSQGRFTTGAAADTTPPTVSGTGVTTNTTSAALSFTTSESARARVWLGTTSPVSTEVSPVIDENSFSTAHSASLSSLAPSTLYHYIISVVDSAGNRATTSDATFTTSVPADTTAPVISSITAATTTSSAAISWTTNESTNGTLYFSQTTPVNTATASTVLVSVFATTHQASLSGLTSSTTYHYLIVARDTSGNTATSSEHSFIID